MLSRRKGRAGKDCDAFYIMGLRVLGDSLMVRNPDGGGWLKLRNGRFHAPDANTITVQQLRKLAKDKHVEVVFDMRSASAGGPGHLAAGGVVVELEHLVSGKRTSPYVLNQDGREEEDPRLRALDP